MVPAYPGQFANFTVPAGSVRWVGPHGTTAASYIAAPALECYADAIYCSVSCAVAPTSGLLTIIVVRNAL